MSYLKLLEVLDHNSMNGLSNLLKNLGYKKTEAVGAAVNLNI